MFGQNKPSFLRSAWGRSFLVTLFFVTLAAFLFWLDAFREYRSETKLLIIGKTAAVSTHAAENLAEVARSLAFYDRVLADNGSIEDIAEDMPPTERKKAWNETVTVRRHAESDVVTIAAYDASPEMSRVIAKQTAQSMILSAGLYYDLRSDIDIRIIENAITVPVVTRPLFYVVMSLVSGLAVTSLFFIILTAIPNFFPRTVRKEPETETDAALSSHEEEMPYIDPKKFIPAKPSALSYDMPFSANKKNGSAFTKAPAPSNLPTADDEMDLPVSDEPFPYEFEESASEHEESGSDLPVETFSSPEDEEKALAAMNSEHYVPETEMPGIMHIVRQDEQRPEEEKTGEPSAEEYKRRLNQLLAGE